MKNVEACRSPEIGYGTKIVLIFGIAGPKNPKKVLFCPGNPV